MWGSRLLRDRTPTRHRELLQFAPWCVRSSPSGLPFFSVSASHHLLFSGSATDFSHHDREFAPASIRLLLFHRRERDGACLRVTISPAARHTRHNCPDPTPSLCRHRIAPRE